MRGILALFPSMTESYTSLFITPNLSLFSFHIAFPILNAHPGDMLALHRTVNNSL